MRPFLSLSIKYNIIIIYMRLIHLQSHHSHFGNRYNENAA